MKRTTPPDRPRLVLFHQGGHTVELDCSGSSYSRVAQTGYRTPDDFFTRDPDYLPENYEGVPFVNGRDESAGYVAYVIGGPMKSQDLPSGTISPALLRVEIPIADFLQRRPYPGALDYVALDLWLAGAWISGAGVGRCRAGQFLPSADPVADGLFTEAHVTAMHTVFAPRATGEPSPPDSPGT